ncbi:DUF3421 domain-containing protein [Thalassomonas viridans]|uniref:DUF3421 domain-containing protein n=1 Tax=Thalassomonas viridans TaxID=137584 RepID=A0AAE9Z4T7_9GAMM|nr:DM9 repeat-containing protein [Thalassomonas viridans]WDE06292.1 DUF3421 domain-containing protein [Thalassomonas viridans]
MKPITSMVGKMALTLAMVTSAQVASAAKWVPYADAIQSDMISSRATPNGNFLTIDVYVCRDKGGIPGEGNFSHPYGVDEYCLIPWVSKAYVNYDFDVLVLEPGDNPRWVDYKAGNIHPVYYGAFNAGTASDGATRYICRTKGSSQHLGYYIHEHQKCYFPYGNNQYSTHDMQILVDIW